MIDGATNLQGYNRYSYVQNNPLNATDPTGYSAWTKFRDNILKPVVAIVVSYWIGPSGSWGLFGTTGGGAIASAAAAGFIAGGITTGSLRGAAIGAFSGAIFGAIGQSGLGDTARLFAHGFSGGVLSVLQGGKFGHGFASAFGTKALSPAINNIDNEILGTVVAAVVGGTISEATGGKFANGARTSAFAYMFNQLASKRIGIYTKGPDSKAFKARARAGTSNVTGVDTGEEIIDALSGKGNLSRVDIHSHGYEGGVIGNGVDVGLYNSQVLSETNPGATTVGHFVSAVENGTIELSRDAEIIFYGCNMDATAQELSIGLGDIGRSDVLVTGSNSSVMEVNNSASAVRGNIYEPRNTKFNTYSNGKVQSSFRTLSYD